MKGLDKGTRYPSNLDTLQQEVLSICRTFQKQYFECMSIKMSNVESLKQAFLLTKNFHKLESIVSINEIDDSNRVKDVVGVLCISSYRYAYAEDIKNIVINYFEEK